MKRGWSQGRVQGELDSVRRSRAKRKSVSLDRQRWDHRNQLTTLHRPYSRPTNTCSPVPPVFYLPSLSIRFRPKQRPYCKIQPTHLRAFRTRYSNIARFSQHSRRDRLPHISSDSPRPTPVPHHQKHPPRRQSHGVCPSSLAGKFRCKS